MPIASTQKHSARHDKRVGQHVTHHLPDFFAKTTPDPETKWFNGMYIKIQYSDSLYTVSLYDSQHSTYTPLVWIDKVYQSFKFSLKGNYDKDGMLKSSYREYINAIAHKLELLKGMKHVRVFIETKEDGSRQSWVAVHGKQYRFDRVCPEYTFGW